MKVLVLNNAAPFIWGGAEELADNLVHHLNGVRGVEAELLRLPFQWNPADRVVEEILLHRQFRLLNVDRVIALKFPAYLVPHQDKTLWLLHQYRQAYDLYDHGQSHFGQDDRSLDLIKVVRAADDQCFKACSAIYVNSPVTQKRLKTYNGFDGTVLYPPVNDPERFTGGEHGDYIFAGGRVGPAKRQHLLVEAMARVRSPLRLIVAGPPEDPAYIESLRTIIARNGLEDRVELRLGLHDRDTIASLANGALACAYIPFDEDSLGYVTMEAFTAAKAVITTTDSGGLLEIVIDGRTGTVATPDPDALGEGLERLAADRARSIEMGKSAKDLMDSKNLNWDATVKRLLR